MTSLSSTYLIPALLLNPVVILHGFNTFCSHFISTNVPAASSNHRWLENLGPTAASGPYLDVHDNTQLCWGYTALMIIVQVLAYGKVNDTRVRKKSARAAAKAERERNAARREHKSGSEAYPSAMMNCHVSECDAIKDSFSTHCTKSVADGRTSPIHDDCSLLCKKKGLQNIEDSTTEPSSEEETIV